MLQRIRLGTALRQLQQPHAELKASGTWSNPQAAGSILVPIRGFANEFGIFFSHSAGSFPRIFLTIQFHAEGRGRRTNATVTRKMRWEARGDPLDGRVTPVVRRSGGWRPGAPGVPAPERETALPVVIFHATGISGGEIGFQPRVDSRATGAEEPRNLGNGASLAGIQHGPRATEDADIGRIPLPWKLGEVSRTGAFAT